MRVFIALGSNLGDGADNLCQAIDQIAKNYPIITRSSVLITKAKYIEDQPDFYNQVIEVQGHGSALEMLAYLHQIEHDMGRVRTIKYGPRIIDLDIVFFGNQIINTNELQIPHPGLFERDFVLSPLNEIAPDFICPATGKTVRELYRKIKIDSIKI
ncbi:MAG: 2-amino-4-hydroxy-6-hydroxymethyldihydropteridine diphosphokinase [Candidatus Paracaedibacteraceae bacterium]|nr:2-amino-4-hydroxy-6-hydroxymethyldihydropteridine diphosphokinase [Candidatus Paracaedibacteraceae bacterium]